jgi:peptide deformylase
MPEPLDIVCYPDPILRRPTAPVGEVTDEIRELIPVLTVSMREAKGLGLAANQVGIGKRLALVSDTGEEEDIRVVIDPEIVATDGALAMEEGCLSFPGLLGLITRPERVTVRYTNLDGERITEETDGLLARCFLHEIDHLDGILFISKMTPADRIRLKRSLRDMEEEYAERS